MTFVTAAICDLGHPAGPDDLETVEFSLDGRGYEIDLCHEHAAALRDDVEEFVGAGRVPAPRRPRRRP